MDFTLSAYGKLLSALKEGGYTFLPFGDYLEQFPGEGTVDLESPTRGQGIAESQRLVILRHDVDLRPERSLQTARMENQLGIRGSYYFRMIPQSFDPEIIKAISQLGHEVGYHYETMDTAHRRLKGKRGNGDDELVDVAYREFYENLGKIRELAEVKTICMHGSPKSALDNREIWRKYDYKQLGIIGEPYFDLDFNRFFYLTDTGRRWDGWRVSIRDKVGKQDEWERQGLVFRKTRDVIGAVRGNTFPHKVMITVHPQRWTNAPLAWFKELAVQRAKNLIKGVVVWRTNRI
ncbi:MAG TPA: hypothetical protein PKL52_10535 [Tenuifilaceae bacterium]|nr:hypothetical protein [Tenuifilaceae bacterium]